MRIRVLGSAAGGGFPQWNCSCPNCLSVRLKNPAYQARSQSQLALHGDDYDDKSKPRQWHLLNGSPDLRYQLLQNPDMLPDPATPRLSPIHSMTITNADVDHTLGLILLRESQRLRVQSSQFVKQSLLEGNAYFGMLQQHAGQVDWQTVQGGESFEFRSVDGQSSGMSAQVVELEGSAPFWAKQLYPSPDLPVMGLVIQNKGGARVGYFPGVAKLNRDLYRTLETCDVIFFDGTFWTDDEIQRIKGGTRTGRDMGHISMSGPEGSIAQLKNLPKSVRKYFIHINNTNPALNERGAEHATLREAGWELSRDGLELNL